jgi:hypothetical protein
MGCCTWSYEGHKCEQVDIYWLHCENLGLPNLGLSDSQIFFWGGVSLLLLHQFVVKTCDGICIVALD